LPTQAPTVVHRYYDPQTGQFLTFDPLVDETMHAYAYASDDPIDNADPSGLCSQNASESASGGPPPVPIGTPTREDCVRIINYLNELLGSGHNPDRVPLWEAEYQRYKRILATCRKLYGLRPDRPRKRNFAPVPSLKPSPVPLYD